MDLNDSLLKIVLQVLALYDEAQQKWKIRPFFSGHYPCLNKVIKN